MAEYTEPNNNDIFKLALASLLICLSINIVIGFYAYSLSHQGNEIPDSLTLYGDIIEQSPISGGVTIQSTLERQELTELACDRSDPECLGISNNDQSSISTGGDILQVLGNTPKMFKFVLNVISMTVLGPVTIAVTLNSVIDNVFIKFIIIVMGILLNLLIFSAIIKFFFKS